MGGSSADSIWKKLLVDRPILAIYNPQAKTELHTDACSDGIGAVLLQRQADKTLKPVMYFNQQTTDEERNIIRTN